MRCDVELLGGECEGALLEMTVGGLEGTTVSALSDAERCSELLDT